MTEKREYETSDADALSLDDLARIDRICVEFEQAWKEGRSERIEERLSGFGGAVRSRLLGELLALELHHRRQRGEAPSREEFCRRFGDDADVVVAVLEAEASGQEPSGRTVGAIGRAESDSGSVTRDAADIAVPRLPERFEPIAEIARGGMGAVWRVIDRQFGRPLAVKVMLPQLLANREAVARFEREAQLTGSLQHPGIPPVADRGTLDDGSSYFSMKLVEGETLASILAKRGDGTAPERGAAPHPIADLTRLLGIFEQVCQSIGYAHSQGVIHRDLKPANIMVGAFGEVQVMDWGMAKRQATRASTTHSTAATREDTQSSRHAQETSVAPAAHGEEDSQSEGDSLTRHRRGTVRAADSSDTSPSITRDGTVMGTPAYMPPEQARGEVDSLDSRSDVFGLGAILCEILTGQRPYSGDDVWRRAAAGDVADATARLDRSGADRELVELCKRCLSPNPEQRPPNGTAVAETIQRYSELVQQRLEQEKTERAAAEARATEEAKRAKVEQSRRRVAWALAASVLLLVAGGSVAAWWYEQDRIAKATAAQINSDNAEREIQDLLTRAADLRDRYEFDTAASLLAQADGRTAALLEPSDLTARISQAEKDLAVVNELNTIRLRKGAKAESGYFDVRFASGSEGAFAQTFRAYGINIVNGQSPQAIGAQIAVSDVREALLAALDDWAMNDDQWRRRILEVAYAADEDPLWQKLHDPANWLNRKALLDLARITDVHSVAPTTIESLSLRLEAVGETTLAVELLTQAALLYPQDFWVQFEAAGMLSREPFRRNNEAIGYYRAAISVWPGNAAAHNNLGRLLRGSNQLEGAEAAYRMAIELDPDYAAANYNLGNLLVEIGRLSEAEAAYRKAIAASPKHAKAHNNLAIAIGHVGRLKEAEAEYHKATELEPDYAEAHYNLAQLLLSMGRPAEAAGELRRAMEIDPKFAEAQNDRGDLLAEANRLAEAEAEEYRKAIERDPECADFHYNLAHLLAQSHRLREAEAELRKAIDIDPKLADAHTVLGIVLVELGRDDEGEAAFRGAIELDGDNAEALCNLGMLYVQSTDRFGEAVALLERGHELGITQAGWPYPSAEALAEARRLLALDQKLAALADVRGDKSDASEVLQLANFAFVRKKRPGLAAQLYAQALEDDWVDDRTRYLHLYGAAWAAARVAAGDVEEGATPLSPDEKTAWRRRALRWLRENLSMLQQMLASRDDAAREAAIQQLSHWVENPELATLRGPAIEQLPADEQAAWHDFWADVDETRSR